MQTFRAMNTDVTVVAESTVVDAVARVFADAEQRFSRFRPDSELSRLNRASGPVVVSAPMFEALVAARRHVERTGGLFDPAIGGALAALGYDRSFAPGALDRDTEGPASHYLAARFLDLALDAAHRVVTRPAHVQLDLGGMIKGRTVDAAAACLPTMGAIDAGGDAVLRGGGWLVDVEDPRDATRSVATIRVTNAAVATSAANRRRWRVANAVRHHLVDPRTARPADTDLLQVTIVAATAELAEVIAKAVFVLGRRAGEDFLARQDGIGAVLVCESGDTIAHAVEVVS
jgi:thiamine biosynthesis lipoprotein